MEYKKKMRQLVAENDFLQLRLDDLYNIVKKKEAEIDFLADRPLDKLESALMYYQLIIADDFDRIPL